MDTLASRLTNLHQKYEAMMSKGYERVAISFCYKIYCVRRDAIENAGFLPGKPGSDRI